MNKISIILLFLIFQITKGQSNLDDLKKYIENIENVSELYNLKNVKFKHFSVITAHTDIERDIDFGYKHHRIEIVPYDGYDMKLNIISKDDKIQTAWVSEFDSYKNKYLKIKIVIKNPDFLSRYVKKHNTLYYTKLTDQDFMHQITKEYVVGFGCGITGNNIPREAKKMLKFVKHKNRKKLQEYLTSFSPELQALGTIGLLKIGKLSLMQKNIIEHLKKRNSIVSTCSGCLYGINIKFTEAIK